jgi:hypothetical protein
MYRSLMFRALENEQRDVPHLPKLSRRALGRHFLLILRVLCCSADMSQLLDLEEEYDEDDDVDGVNTSASSDPHQLLMENSSLMVGFYSKLQDIEEDDVFEDTASEISRSTTPTAASRISRQLSSNSQSVIRFGGNRLSVDGARHWPQADLYRRLSSAGASSAYTQLEQMSSRYSVGSVATTNRYSFGTSPSIALAAGDGVELPMFLLLYRGYWRKKFKRAKAIHKSRFV